MVTEQERDDGPTQPAPDRLAALRQRLLVRPVAIAALASAVAIVVAVIAVALLVLGGDEEASARTVDDGGNSPAVAADSTPTPEPTLSATPDPDATAFALPDGTVARVANTGGRGVGLRSDCDDEARQPGAWADGTLIELKERGLGECSGWSFASANGDSSWIRNTYIASATASGGSGGGGGGAVLTITGTSSALVSPGQSWAQRYCIQYSSSGGDGEVCRTFPSVQQSGWTEQDQVTFAALTEERRMFFVECYLLPPVVGELLDDCAFAPLFG